MYPAQSPQRPATGAVEKARNILERDFEAGLKFVRVNDIDTLNDLVRQWRITFNGKAIHSRYGTNRTAKWLEIITTGKLVPPPVDICRELAISAPETRTVTSKLRIKFRSQEFSVSTVPGANVGDELRVARNPWHENEARVIVTGEDGFETYYPVMAIEKDQWGYAVDAPVIGERYQTLPQSDAEINRQEVEQAVYGTQRPNRHVKRVNCRSVDGSIRISNRKTRRCRLICRIGGALRMSVRRYLKSGAIRWRWYACCASPSRPRA